MRCADSLWHALEILFLLTMLFNSTEYLLFLPAIVLLFFVTPHRVRWAVLVVASYFFYMYWRPEYALLLLFSTFVDYWVAIRLHQSSSKRARNTYLAISLSANLGLLFLFKYFTFFNTFLRDTFSVFDFAVSTPQLDLLLPVGISFYTFQTLSYTIDIYRKKRTPERHFGIFALYVSFFPQLVAGPIERSTTLLPQFHERQTFSAQRIISGGKLVLWGLFKKVVLADTFGIYVGHVYNHPESYGGIVLVLATIGFGLQLYLDFSAYTDMSIGSARMLGFDLMSNFNRPLMARTVREFWSRWHISLTTWLFDYLYRPLARLRWFPWQINILLLFLAIGIWHGAGWNFVWFGLYAGVIYLLSYYTLDIMAETISGTGRKAWLLGQAGWLMTMVLMGVGAILFRASDITGALDYYGQIANGPFWSLDGLKMATLDKVILLTAFPVFILVQRQPMFDAKSPLDSLKPVWLRWLIYYFLLFSLLFFGQRGPEEFIYFQF